MVEGELKDSALKGNEKNILKASELYKFYIEFNNLYNINENDLQAYNSSLKLPKEDSAKEFYKKYIRNIRLLSELYNNHFNYIDNGKNIINRCIYMKYWFYDQLLNNNINDDEIDIFYNYWESPPKKIHLDKNLTCDIYRIKSKDIKEIKKIYNYFVFYDRYNNFSAINYNKNGGLYCNYQKWFSEFYKAKEEVCLSNETKEICKELNTYVKKYITENILSSLTEECEQNKITQSSRAIDNGYYTFINLETNNDKKNKDLENYCNDCQSTACLTNKYTENGINICEKIIKMLSVIGKNMTSYNINNFKYLNFWFNHELRKITKYIEYRQDMYNLINSICTESKDFNELKSKIYDVEDDEYKKWSIMYDLYFNYNKIENEYLETLKNPTNKISDYAKICVNKYNEGIEIYKKHQDSDYADDLIKFSILYNNAKKKTKSYRKLKLPELPKLILLNESKEKIEPEEHKFCNVVKSNVTLPKASTNSKYGNILKNFSTEKIYKALDNKEVDALVCAKYCKKIINNNINSDKFKALCSKLVTNLKYLSIIGNTGNKHEDRCSNLTYWTYDIIMKIFSANGSHYLEKDVSRELNNIILRVNNELEKNENCIFYVDGSFLDWNEEKDLHDYFEHYNDLSKLTADKINNEMYCQYINNISNLYKKYMNICCTCYSRPEYVCEEHCPNFFKCNMEYFPIHLSHKLECKDNVSLQKEKENYESLIIDLDVIRKSQLVAMNFYKILTQDYFYRFVFSTFILLGIFFFFFIFYKFTPNRFKSNKNRSKKKQNNYHNNAGNRKELIEYEKKTVNGNSNKKRLRIAYHST
ncbi:PIR protein [Plasmodium vivax]|nr:PIR protein [Plasmodium vivax]